MTPRGPWSGKEGRGATAAPSPLPRLFPVGTHVERTPLEFLVQLRGCIRTRLQLPSAFANAMEEEKSPMLWLQMHGCGNGAEPVDVEHPEPRLLFLGRGWKSFARAHNLWDGNVLRFKMMADNLLSVKLYGSSGVRLGCYEESSSWTESPSSHGRDEEGTDGNNNGDGSDPRQAKPGYEDLTSD
ncbi:l-ascorbate oxidase-like protein [Hordeum vulgare]|nr:l-ascorbate oxidase-like protein [Hordeum vulgare]